MDARFPVGPMEVPARRDAGMLRTYAERLDAGSRAWREVIGELGVPELSRRYREGSFTVRQLAHHVADAHELGFMRFRWGLTDRSPAILPMDQDAWARLADYELHPNVALQLLDAVNDRWTALLRQLSAEELARTIRHPEEGEQDLWRLLAKHEWHVRHHLGHVQLALGRR